MRIETQVVIDAVAKNSGVLLRNKAGFYEREGNDLVSACALTHVLLAKVGVENFRDVLCNGKGIVESLCEELSLTRQYVWNFALGFDDPYRSPFTQYCMRDDGAGAYNDGKEAFFATLGADTNE